MSATTLVTLLPTSLTLKLSVNILHQDTLTLWPTGPVLIGLVKQYKSIPRLMTSSYQLVDKIGWYVLFVPFGNFLNDHFSFINFAC